MKTKLCRPVLVDSKERTDIVKHLNRFHWAEYVKGQTSVEGQCYYFSCQQLILISLDPDDKIKDEYEGQFVFMYPNSETWLMSSNGAGKNMYKNFGYKIVANQDQLSPEYINQFIKEYSKNEVKDVEIEMDDNYDDVNRLIDVEFPKLTNGFVTIVKKDKSTREQAIEWWNNLCWTDKFLLRKRVFSGRHPQCLTGREIEKIWEQELQEESTKFEYEVMDSSSNYSNNKEMVDFEMLTASIRTSLRGDVISEYQRNNFNLFFKKLSESSSFAHKAHKELQRLNK